MQEQLRDRLRLEEDIHRALSATSSFSSSSRLSILRIANYSVSKRRAVGIPEAGP
jgi:hypothetical protein